MKRLIAYIFITLIFCSAPAVAKKVHYPNGDFYSGGWDKKLSCPNGKGTMKYANGDCYIGFWANGKQQGKGIMTYVDGSSYDGEWAEGKMEGQGSMRYADGRSYVGHWKCGYWNGVGRLENNGEIYDGEWIEGLMEGQGSMSYADGSIYRGQWKEGVWEGRGRLEKNGNIYDGEWVNGIMEGQGAMNYADGSLYKGQWKNGLWEGQGRLEKDGSIYDGFWKDGKMNGEGSIVYSDGSAFQGSLIDGIKEGYGMMIFADGGSYSGEWHDNKCFGEGVRTNAKQERIQSTHWDGEEYGLPVTITERDGNKRRIYVDGVILSRYNKDNSRYSHVDLEFPELGTFRCYVFQPEGISLEEELYQANRFPIKYLAEGTFTYIGGEKERCFNRPILAWGETVKPDYIKGEWIETEVYAKPAGDRMTNNEIDSTPNSTQASTLKTFMSDRKFSFNANGTGVFSVSTFTTGNATAVTGRVNNGFFQYSVTSPGGFDFIITGLVKITFTWKLSDDGILTMKSVSVSPSVKTELDIEKYRSECDPTYFKQWSSSIKSSYKSHPDVKHAENRVKEILKTFSEIVLGDFAVLFPGTGKIYLYDLDSNIKYKSINHPFKIMDSIMGFERPVILHQ